MKYIYFLKMTYKIIKPANLLFIIIPLFLISCTTSVDTNTNANTILYKEGINLIPCPQETVIEGDDFMPGEEVSIVLDENASEKDILAAEVLKSQLITEWNIKSNITKTISGKSIVLTRKEFPEEIASLTGKKAEQAYEMIVSAKQVTIKAKGEAGLFYGVQTLLQTIKNNNGEAIIKGLKITDWPDIPERACHYDTKHHQDKREYVESFIRDLARYKINMLVWEWEDKFEYPSHPEIGAPGAFTMKEMQELTRYAQNYHVQIVPLVQGLGHVSYILKWPQFSHLREFAASNWEFCPLKEGSYKLLNDLWMDAIEATPGSEYIHIGTDESYELGKGIDCGCNARMKEIGKDGMMTEFISRCAEPLIKQGRTVMAWSAKYQPNAEQNPPAGMVSDILSKDIDKSKAAKKAGYEVFVYDPNPGIEPLFLPYFYRLRPIGNSEGIYTSEEEIETCLQNSYNVLSHAATSGVFDGMINTSWDDAGLHNQEWMMSFVNSAEYSWSGNNPSLEEFSDKFFLNYYGNDSKDMKELYTILNKAGYYYYKSFERRVWHYGDIGKTHLPDLPRGDNLEYNEFWNREYANKIDESQEQLKQMERATQIIQANMDIGVKNSYDLEIFTSIAELVKHTCNTYLSLSKLERAIKEAHRQRFLNHEAAYRALGKAMDIIDTNLNERKEVYDNLVAVWEKSRLPKGLSTPEKKFFHRQDRARHFAFRKADMSYLIYDEELLGLEDYKVKLQEYMEWYKQTFL